MCFGKYDSSFPNVIFLPGNICDVYFGGHLHVFVCVLVFVHLYLSRQWCVSCGRHICIYFFAIIFVCVLVFVSTVMCIVWKEVRSVFAFLQL